MAEGGLSLSERRLRMRRQLSAPGELTPQLQQLNIKVKVSRRANLACTAELFFFFHQALLHMGMLRVLTVNGNPTCEEHS